jgi:hypothetical protein
MTKFVGRLGTLGVALEASRGVPVAPTYWLPYVSMSFFDKTTTENEEQGMGVVADNDSVYVTMQMAEGDVESQLYDNALGYILSSILGAVPVTTGGSPYTHTFTLSNTNQQKSLSLYWKDPVFSLMFPLAVVEQLSLKVEASAIVSWTITFKAKRSREWTRLTPDFTTLGSKFLHQHLVTKLADNVGALTAASGISIKNLELNINRNTVFDEVIGTSEPEDVLGQQLTVEGNMTLNIEDTTYRGYMLNGTYKSMELNLLRSSSSSLDLRFPRVSFTEWEPDFALNEIAKQKINFKANYDAANALDIISTAVLINSKVSY